MMGNEGAPRREHAARPFVLAECTWAAVRETPYTVAVLPWGATEAHNTHLPYATDVMESESIAIAAAARAWERGARVIVLPAVPFGVQTTQREIPFCLNMNPSTQLAVLRDVCESIEPHGIRALVLLNGHGGNDFRPIIRELTPRVGLLLVQVNWYQAVNAQEFFDTPGDHAGELETSLMLHLAPGLVGSLGTAGAGAARPFAIAALREGWAWTPRHWVKVTDDTGVGDPHAATAEKGRHYFEAVVARIGDLLVDLAAANPHDLYQHGGASG
ncbi:MAG TPA: creatininase family protein [Gemmatimonadaceae bacterium]